MCRGEGGFFGAGNTNLVGGKESIEGGDYQIFEAYCPETQSNGHNQMKQATAGFIEKWFNKAFFVDKNVHLH